MFYNHNFAEYRFTEIDAYMKKERPGFTEDALCRGTIYAEIEEARKKAELRGGEELLDVSTTFFPSRGGSMKVAAAKKICSECPVQKECFEYGYERREQAGIWGGASVNERDACHREELDSDEAFIILFGKSQFLKKHKKI